MSFWILTQKVLAVFRNGGPGATELRSPSLLARKWMVCTASCSAIWPRVMGHCRLRSKTWERANLIRVGIYGHPLEMTIETLDVALDLLLLSLLIFGVTSSCGFISGQARLAAP
jgi:hypothetical protein